MPFGSLITSTWTGGSGNWSDPLEWNPSIVPNNGNNGSTFDVVFGSGSLTQDITAGVTIQQLQMSGGTLTLSNPLTLNAGLLFSGGTINGGILNIAGTSEQSATMAANGLTINNSGTYNFAFDNNNIFIGSVTFNNSGTLTKVTGSATDVFNSILNNTGTVSVQSGTLQLAGGGTSSGVVTVSARIP